MCIVLSKCHKCVYIHRNQNCVSYPLERELHTVVNHPPWVLGTQLRFSRKAGTETSFQPPAKGSLKCIVHMFRGFLVVHTEYYSSTIRQPFLLTFKLADINFRKTQNFPVNNVSLRTNHEYILMFNNLSAH